MKKEVLFILLVFFLVLSLLPSIQALEISQVRVESITETSAIIKWETDQSANSFVSYGSNKSLLKTEGDARLVSSHQFPLENLNSAKTYHYKVRSDDVEDDNNASLYSFKTLEPDLTAPIIKVEIPQAIPGNKLDITGSTEANAEVTLRVNGMPRGKTTAKLVNQTSPTTNNPTPANFSFLEVSLLENEWNTVSLEAKDSAGNLGNWSGKVFSDTAKPKLELSPVPELINSNEVLINGSISKNCSIEIFVNGQSSFQGTGNTINQKLFLKEGENKIKIVAKDSAGWETTKEFKTTSDTLPPQINFDFERGTEYYQGRAETNIFGNTKPGSTLYLYIYRPLGYNYVPQFDKAWAKITADQNGSFVFKAVNFEQEPLSLDKLAPKEVPMGLKDVSVFPTEVATETQRWTYYVYVISEDKTGKTAYTQRTVTLNTCYSPNFAFNINSNDRFQAPLRLAPHLLEEGKEVISAWFNISYRGSASPKIDATTGREIEPAFRIVNPARFEKACTQGLLNDSAFNIGCRILPVAPQMVPNSDKTAYYLTWGLYSAKELNKIGPDFWNDFKKRMLKFPLKITLTYQERLGENQWSDTKTQTSCYDLGYFVDIPLDTQKLLPDWLVNGGTSSLDWTIGQIDQVVPYLEKAILVSGVGCITGFLSKMVVKYAREVTSKLEYWFTRLNTDENKKCPLNQNSLYLQSTINNWKELESKRSGSLSGDYAFPTNYPEKVLDNKCPWTANFWQVEAALDQLYRWSCDRVFCRKVPAGWTSSADENEVNAVILKQEQCAVTASGIPLLEVKDCQNIINKQVTIRISQSNIIGSDYIKQNPSYTCYRTSDGDLYIYDEGNQNKMDISSELKEKGVRKLSLVGNIGTKLNEISPTVKTDLLVYQVPGSNQFIVGKETTCDALCKNPRRPGYNADTKNGDKGCYKEEIDASGKTVLMSKSNTPLRGLNAYSAGYTSDCFIDPNSNEFTKKQCVCVGNESKKQTYSKKSNENSWLRTATKEENDLAESWSYREATIFHDSKGAVGTYYPPWRYYSGRDLSGAFGADHLLDYLNSQKNKDYHEVNPSTDHIAAFQTLCLSGIRARLIMLKSIMVGLRNCLQEAKYTGMYNAGACKTLFTQNVCGLMYKAIAYLSSGCSPATFEDVGKGKPTEGDTFDDVGAVFKAGFGSIGTTMESSISEIKDDYGNSKLNEFFATGSKGFAQSMCMWAFGFDFPLGFDFITDAAYAVPMKTTPQVILSDREISGYNPKEGTAIYNYNVGAIILPGCKIRNYNIYLKCVGPEDNGKPGVQCGAQGCDCYNLMGGPLPLESERVRYLDGGRGADLRSGQMFSVPLPSPQKIDSHFRYDHVVIELQLDQNEKAENCFDEGYRDGKFYFPITDVSPKGELICQVQPTTGKYFCPDLVKSFFGKLGLAYLEEPYVECWNEKTKGWMSCDTPNLFVLNNEIKTRVRVVSDGKGYCLKGTVMGGLQKELLPRQILENIPGTLNQEYSLGVVTEQLLTGVSSTLTKSYSESNRGCQSLMPVEGSVTPYSTSTNNAFRFVYSQGSDSQKYKLIIPTTGVTVNPPFSGTPGGLLTRDARQEFTLEEINSAAFNLDSFKVRNVLGIADFGSQPQACVYQTVGAGSLAPVKDYTDLSVSFSLMYPDKDNNCYYAKDLVSTTAGKSSHTQTIRIQRSEMALQEATDVHTAFKGGNYNYVESWASNVINRREGDYTNALAVYYYIAANIMKGKMTNQPAAYEGTIKQLLILFFERKDALGKESPAYPADVLGRIEYKKILAYLCEVDKNYGAPHSTQCMT